MVAMVTKVAVVVIVDFRVMATCIGCFGGLIRSGCGCYVDYSVSDFVILGIKKRGYTGTDRHMLLNRDARVCLKCSMVHTDLLWAGFPGEN